MKVEDANVDKIQQYEAAVELANRTKTQLDPATVAKIEELIGELDKTDDTIFKVTCLQLIADLACSNQAMKILEQKDVPQKLISILNESDPLIVPHALKLFYRVDPSNLEAKYPQVLDRIFEYCLSDNKQLLDYAVDIVAAIGRGGLQARKVLARHPKFRVNCLAYLGTTIISSDSLLKSRTLKCIYDLLEIQEDDPQQEASDLSEDIYHSIIPGEQKMTNQLLSLCRVPFMEIRINAMLVLSAIATQVWGQKELAAHPKFVEWILDRSSEACKESKEAKFEILKHIVKSKTASRIFKTDDYMKMRADFKNGPFHVGIAEEMLMDDTPAS